MIKYRNISGLLTATFLFVLLFSANPQALAQYKSASTTQLASMSLSEGEKISRLIQFVETMPGATFIRNGAEHSPQEAATHLKSKFEKHQDRVKTATDFIEHLATKSSMTGEYYKIRLADGTTQETCKILYKELERLENKK